MGYNKTPISQMKLKPGFFIVYDLVITKFACVFNFCNTTLNDKIMFSWLGAGEAGSIRSS